MSRPSDTDPKRGVVDGRRFLEMSKSEAMETLRIRDESTYDRAVRDVTEMVQANERSGNHSSVVIKKSGQKVSGIDDGEG